MSREPLPARPVSDPGAAKAEHLRREIQTLEAPAAPPYPSNAYTPRQEYRTAIVLALAAVAVAIFLIVGWPLAEPDWPGRVQPAATSSLHAPHAGRWLPEDAAQLGDPIAQGHLFGRIEDAGLRAALSARRVELQAASAAVESLRTAAARQQEAHAAATSDYDRSEITRSELTVVELATRDLALRLALAEATLTAASSDVTRIERDLEREQVRAPQAGTLLHLELRRSGTYVAAGELLAEIGAAPLVIHFAVPEKQMARRWRVGDRVTFTCAGMRRRFAGMIERVEPRLREEEQGPLREKVRSGLVVVRPLEALPAEIRPGLLATGRLD